jgi:signal transduction histidine kinase
MSLPSIRLPRIPLSHRSRLVLVAAGSAGILFLVFFGIILFGLQKTERKWAGEELNASIGQVVADMRKNHGKSDLAEVVGANPEVSLSIYDREGNEIATNGSVDLTSTMRDGIVTVGETDYLLVSRKEGSDRIVAALNWTNHQAIIDRFISLALIMLGPLVAVVGFATWAAARATFKPLRQLAHEAEMIGIQGLNARMQTDDSDEYRDFVDSLNALLDRLEASIKREERFLADAAHELRTPLTVLRGKIETTLSKARSPEEYRDTLDVLLDETRRMSDLVELILRSAAPTFYAHISSDLSSVAEQAHARWVDRFAEKQVRLRLEVLPGNAEMLDVECDVVLNNLLANSLRASSRGTTCIIRARPKGNLIEVSVADEGPGIDEAEMPYVFDIGRNVKTGRPKTGGGFGIGLQLCQRIINGRNGRIWVEPNSPAGCIFKFEVPRAKAIPLENEEVNPPSTRENAISESTRK